LIENTNAVADIKHIATG